VFVRVKGAAAAAPLADAREIPVGSVIDTRGGEVRIEADTGERSTSSVVVSEGRAALSQTRSGVIELQLPRHPCCGDPRTRLRTRTPEARAGASATSSSRKKKKKPKWRTRDDQNKYAGHRTDFTTTRTCRKTTIRVRDGFVEVTNIATGRRVAIVRKGRTRSFAAR
jgi:hypothetical protein